MHVLAVYLGSDLGADEVMNSICGQWFDYYDECTDDSDWTIGDVQVGCLKTAGDLRKLGMDVLAKDIEMIVLSNGASYRNPYRLMTQEQMQQLFALVLANYEDSQEIVIYDVHI